MKSTVCAVVAIFYFTWFPVFAADLDDFKINEEVDSAAFIVGSDRTFGDLSYVVDRTSGLCFAIFMRDKASGMTIVDCEKLKKIPSIRTYLETGKTP